MKNKALLALILAVALLIAGAFLPRIVGAIMDRSASNKMEFAQVSDIHLEFVQSDIPMEEILGIICRNTHSVEVPADLAKHSAEDIHRLTLQAISHYREAGLIQHSIDVTKELRSCKPLLLYEQGSSRKSNIFWEVSLSPSDGSWILELMIDDKSGRVCSIHYDYHVDPDYVDMDYVNTAEPIYENLEDTLMQFSRLFLSELGEEFAELDAEEIEKGTSISVDEGFTSTTVTWEDTIKGECHIVFYVLDTSFYTIHY